MLKSGHPLFILLVLLVLSIHSISRAQDLPTDLESAYFSIQIEPALTTPVVLPPVYNPLATHFLTHTNNDSLLDLVWISHQRERVYWSLGTVSDGFVEDIGDNVFTYFEPGFQLAEIRPCEIDGNPGVALLDGSSGSVFLHEWSNGTLQVAPSETLADSVPATQLEATATSYVTLSAAMNLVTIRTESSGYEPFRHALERAPQDVIAGPSLGLNEDEFMVFCATLLPSDNNKAYTLDQFANLIEEPAFTGFKNLPPCIGAQAWSSDPACYADPSQLLGILLRTLDPLTDQQAAHLFLHDGASWKRTTTVSLPAGTRWLAPVDFNFDGLTDLAAGRIDEAAVDIVWDIWLSTSSEHFAPQSSTVGTASAFSTAISLHGFPLEDNIPNYFETTAVDCPRVTGSVAIRDTTLLAAFCKAIDYINELAESLLNDASTANDAKGNKVKRVGCALNTYKAGNDVSVGDLPGDGKTSLGRFFPTGEIYLSDDFLNQPAAVNCDFASDDWWNLVTTIFHEGAHAAGVGPEGWARDETVCFLEEVVQPDINDPNGIAANWPGWGPAVSGPAEQSVLVAKSDEIDGWLESEDLFRRLCNNLGRSGGAMTPRISNLLGDIADSLTNGNGGAGFEWNFPNGSGVPGTSISGNSVRVFIDFNYCGRRYTRYVRCQL